MVVPFEANSYYDDDGEKKIKANFFHSNSLVIFQLDPNLGKEKFQTYLVALRENET